ncbi:Histidine biosynthesis bifunctional protein HisB [Paenibacillus sp. JJ-223]|nr:Histidine biosynthesis bifunctional protein HisB [Paenibacillus sp. JJ-223]
MQGIQAAFIDRDGTIGGTGHFVHPTEFSLFDGAQGAINMLKQAGIKVFAFTNQHRISRGQAKLEEFRTQFEQYGFDDAFICPHGAQDQCDCKKPKPGMLKEAAVKYGLDLSKCVVIGDVGDTDMLAAHAVGAIKVLVKTGWGESSLLEYRHRWNEVEPDYIAENIHDAAAWILRSLPRRISPNG